MFPFHKLENAIMSRMHLTHETINDIDRRDSFDSMTPSEQLLGTLVVLLVLLLAVVLRSP